MVAQRQATVMLQRYKVETSDLLRCMGSKMLLAKSAVIFPGIT